MFVYLGVAHKDHHHQAAGDPFSSLAKPEAVNDPWAAPTSSISQQSQADPWSTSNTAESSQLDPWSSTSNTTQMVCLYCDVECV